MAEVQFDRVQEATSLAGTGDVPLGGATPGFVTFASVMANGDTSRFVIYDDKAKAWEVFAGTYNATSNAISRPATPEASSNAGAKVNFAGNAGTYVFMDASATFVRTLAPKLTPTFTGTVTINDPTDGSNGPGGAGAGVVIVANANGNGANLTLGSSKGGTTTPNKTLRSIGGLLQVINSGYSASIFALDDIGNVTLSGRLSSQGTIIANNGSAGYAALEPGSASNTGYISFWNGGGVRQGYIGFATNLINMNAEGSATGFNINGTLAVSAAVSMGSTLNVSSDTNIQGFLTGRSGATIINNLTVLDQTTAGSNLTALQVNGTGNPSGANFKLAGNGGTTPAKYIRANGGNFQFINDGYSAVIANIDDSGNFYAIGTVSAQRGGSVFVDNLTINDSNTTGNIANGLTINSPNNGQGANLTLRGQGTATPKKVMRAWAGQWQIVNDAYNAVILGLDDGGNLTIAGKFDQLTAETNRAVAAENAKVGKNLLHNGRFNINQRNSGVVSSGGLPADRWRIGADANATFTGQVALLGDGDRNAIGDDSIEKCMSLTITGSSTAGSFCTLTQAIENVRSNSNKQLTVSFWAYSAQSLQMSVEFEQEFGSGGSPSPETGPFCAAKLQLTNGWRKYTITGTIGSTNGKTVGTDGTNSLTMFIWASGFPGGTYNARNLGLPVQSGNIVLAALKVEVGPVATPLPPRDDTAELNECRRFFQFVEAFMIGGQYSVANNTIYTELPLMPPMRQPPSVVFTNPNYNNASTLAVNNSYVSHLLLRALIGGNSGTSYIIANVSASADL